MSKPSRWLLCLISAVMFTAAPAAFAQGREVTATAPANHKKGRIQLEELQNQHRRLKESRQSIHAEARAAGRHNLGQKYRRHQMKKIQHHASLHSANLRLARKENKGHRKSHQRPQAN